MNYLRYAIGLQETGSAGEAVTVRSPLLAVARLAVDLIVRAVARDDGVESLGAVPALEALPVPGPALGEDLFRGENNATATRTSFAQRGLDLLHINGGCFGRHFALPFGVLDVGHQSQGRNTNVPIPPGAKLLRITTCIMLLLFLNLKI